MESQLKQMFLSARLLFADYILHYHIEMIIYPDGGRYKYISLVFYSHIYQDYTPDVYCKRAIVSLFWRRRSNPEL